MITFTPDPAYRYANDSPAPYFNESLCISSPSLVALAALDWLVKAPGPAGWDYGYDLA